MKANGIYCQYNCQWKKTQMTTRNYRLAQPRQIEIHFDGIPSSMKQTNEIYIDLRAQRDRNDQTSLYANQEQPSMIVPSKQQYKRSSVREVNTPSPKILPVSTYSFTEQLLPAKQQKKHICSCACCDCDKMSRRGWCCLSPSEAYHYSSHQNRHQSSTHSSSYCCFCCCFDDQSSCCDCNCGDCDCGGCDCDCGGFNWSVCFVCCEICFMCIPT